MVAERLKRELEAQAEEGLARPDYERLAASLGVGRRQIDRLFREAVGVSPGSWFRGLRAAQARRLLAQGVDVLNAADRAGYSGPGRLHDAMRRETGMTPGQVRRLGEGVVIRFGFFDTPLGPVLLGATERGLSVLSLCASVGAQRGLDEMHTDFPRATFLEEPPFVEPFAIQLIDWLEERAEHFSPRLDLFGTDFQKSVWAELQRIKPGETASYSDLAERMGKPGAVRAVARACATNRISLAIPCHRAIASDGSLRGYRWGLEWKRKLLAMESGKMDGMKQGIVPISG